MDDFASSPCEQNVDRRALPPFASLRAFEAVGRLGGIRKAASELRVDHSVVSRHVRALETWLGIPLFHRNGATPQLNTQGQRYHHAISAAMVSMAQATREISPRNGRDHLLIWCVPGFATRWLGPNLDHFAQMHPDIEIELRPTDFSANFDHDDADGDIRFVRDISAITPPVGVSWTEVARPPVFPVASPQWCRSNPVFCSARDFISQRLLHEENDEEWRGWMLSHGITGYVKLWGPRLWHAHMTLDAARRSQGMALTNPFLVANDIGEGLLQFVNPTDKHLAAEIGAYVFSCREISNDRPAVRKFRSWITARAGHFLRSASGHLALAPQKDCSLQIAG